MIWNRDSLYMKLNETDNQRIFVMGLVIQSEIVTIEFLLKILTLLSNNY